MLTNHDLLPYKERKKSLSEFEIILLNQDENYQLNLERPMATNQIKEINPNIIHSFIDSIMCHNKVNSLLYSSNAKKELSFYLKQKKSLLKVVPLKNGVGHLSGGAPKTVKSFSQKQILEKTYENIKKSIEDYKMSRNKSLVFLKNKNHNFYNSQPIIEKKLSKLFYKSVNEIRLAGYKRALNKCLNLSKSNKDFIMPKVGLNANDVYSRLYNNYILNTKKKKKKKISTRKNSNISNISNNDNNDNYNHNNYYDNNRYTQIDHLLNYKFLKNNAKIKNFLTRNKRCNSTAGRGEKKIIKFVLKSNISHLENNKQFTLRITPNLVNKCLSKFSGGPQPDDKKENKIYDKDYIKQKFNYKILSLNKINGEKKDISLFNTMIKDDPNLESDIINNKNYKDFYNNSSLHIAVKKNSIEMVKYLLDKNCDVNDINKNGETALHIACRSGYDDIIKLLLEKGADIDIVNFEGKKPFELYTKSYSKNE